MNDEPLLLYQDATVASARWGNVFIDRWLAMGTPAQYDAVTAEYGKVLIRERDARFLSLSVVAIPKARMIPAEVRAAIERRFTVLDKRVPAAAVVVTGGGIVVSLVQAVISGLQALSPLQVTQRVFVDLPAAFTWLQTLEGGRSAQDLACAYDAFERALSAAKTRSVVPR